MAGIWCRRSSPLIDRVDQIEHDNRGDHSTSSHYISRMSRIEQSIALPLRSMVRPGQLAVGSAIAIGGVAILLHGALTMA